MSKRTIIYFSLLIPVILIGIFILINENNKKRKYILYSHLSDFDKDGKQDILLLYTYPIIDLLDLESGEKKWETSAPEFIYEKTMVVADGIFAIAYYKENRIWVRGYSRWNGNILWDFPSSVKSSNMFMHSDNNPIWVDLYNSEEKIILSVKIYNTAHFIAAINRKTGGLEWEESISANLSHSCYSYLFDGQIIIVGRNNACAVNTQSGKQITLYTNSSCNRPLFVKDKCFFFWHGNELHKHQTIAQLIEKCKSSKTIGCNSFSPKFNSAAIYNNNIIGFSFNSITSIPLTTNNDSSEKLFKWRMEHVNNGIYTERLEYPYKRNCGAGINDIQTRYFPILKIIDDSSKTKQLLIFDLEKGEISWSSKNIEHSSLKLL